jgi:hypothetical protein
VSGTNSNNIYYGGQDSTISGVSSSTLKMFQPTTSSSYSSFYSNTFIGMSTGEEIEPKVNYINANFGYNGVKCTRIVENKYVTMPDGSKFLKIFSHDLTNNSTIFKDEEDAKFNIHSSNKFSKLTDIPLFTTTDSRQIGASSMSSYLNGTYMYFCFGNQSSVNIVCDIKIVATKSNGKEDVLEYRGFNIKAKKMYYAQLPESTYDYANIYFDNDYDYFF